MYKLTVQYNLKVLLFFSLILFARLSSSKKSKRKFYLTWHLRLLLEPREPQFQNRCVHYVFRDAILERTIMFQILNSDFFFLLLAKFLKCSDFISVVIIFVCIPHVLGCFCCFLLLFFLLSESLKLLPYLFPIILK